MKNSYFLSQPHQPFFLLAFINAIVTMVLFLLSYKGAISLTLAPSSFHAYGLLFLLFTPAFLAFIFTTFPRFSSTPAIEKEIYVKVFGLFLLGSILFVLGTLFNSSLYVLSMFILLGGHFWAVSILENIYSNTQVTDKHDLFWILLGMMFGLFSHIFFVAAHIFFPSLEGLSLQIAIYLYLFLVAFSVAQRMVPFFSHCMVEKNSQLLKHLVLLLLLHLLLESIYENASFLIDLLIAYVVAKELLRWKLPFPNPNPLLNILHIALFWIPLAFIIAGITNFVSLIMGTPFLFLDIHLLALGFVFTILIGFGTRVTLGHSGNMMVADKVVVALFYGTQMVVLMRLLTSFAVAFGWNFMPIFEITVMLWLLLFIIWGIRFFKTLIFQKK